MSFTPTTTAKRPQPVRGPEPAELSQNQNPYADPDMSKGNDMALADLTATRSPFETQRAFAADAAHQQPAATGHDQAGHDQAGPTPAPELPVDAKQAALKAVGGPWGIVCSAIPTVVFATAVAFASLPVSIGVSVVVALAIAALQLWRGQPLSSAAGGLIGVVAAGGVSAVTGSANDFFLISIWAALAAGLVTLASSIARRPVTGVVWNAIHGGTHAWREDRPSLRAHHIATWAVTLMFAARFGIQQWLYVADSTSGLAIADTALGFPLTGLVAVVVVWAFRRSTKRLAKPAEAAADARS